MVPCLLQEKLTALLATDMAADASEASRARSNSVLSAGEDSRDADALLKQLDEWSKGCVGKRARVESSSTCSHARLPASAVAAWLEIATLYVYAPRMLRVF